MNTPHSTMLASALCTDTLPHVLIFDAKQQGLVELLQEEGMDMWDGLRFCGYMTLIEKVF